MMKQLTGIGRIVVVFSLWIIRCSSFFSGYRGIVSLSHATRIRMSALDQDSTPLVEALAQAAGSVRSPLFYPGHKMGSGAPERFVDTILGGKLDALQHDLPELPELDNLFAPEGAIRDAELLAAEAFGAVKTWLLANGSTCGIIASILACVQRHKSQIELHGGSERIGGELQSLARHSVVILPRDAHKSAVHGLILSGATPCFLAPLRHLQSGISLGICKEDLKDALERYGDESSPYSDATLVLTLDRSERDFGLLRWCIGVCHPYLQPVAGVLLVSPTYEGVCADVSSMARICHSAGVPLIVDEAHGAHLRFLGTEEEHETFPAVTKIAEMYHDVESQSGTPTCIMKRFFNPVGALQCGADLVIQSAHKTLGSLTQSAFLHLGNGVLRNVEADVCEANFSPERAVSDALATVQSSSPNYLLLSSLDAARWSMSGADKNGRRLLQAAVKLVHGVRKEIGSMQGVRLLELGEEEIKAAGVIGMDPLRLTLLFDKGLGGFEADDMLTEEFGVYCELSGPGSITFVFGPGSTVEHGETFVEAVRQIGREAARRGVSNQNDAEEQLMVVAYEATPPARQICTPREAFFSPSKTLRACEAIGLASADTVCPYPPGIPILLPGEVITEEALKILAAVKAGGGMISGCSDPTLNTMRVVDYCVPSI